MVTLQETIKDAENKRRTMEENVDSLNEEYAKLKAQGMGHEILFLSF